MAMEVGEVEIGGERRWPGLRMASTRRNHGIAVLSNCMRELTLNV